MRKESTMAGVDRSELIRALGNAYKPAADSSNGVYTENIRMDGHSYARVVKVGDGDESEKKAYFDYPEAVIIRDFANMLKLTRDRSAENAGRELESKFLKAAQFGDNAAIEHMIDISRSFSTRLRGMSETNPQRVLMLMLAEGEIAKLK